MTEERRRVGNPADALFQKMKRQTGEKDRTLSDWRRYGTAGKVPAKLVKLLRMIGPDDRHVQGLRLRVRPIDDGGGPRTAGGADVFRHVTRN